MTNRDFRPIALLTDFGTRDYFVAAIKGVILSIAPGAPVVDVTHDVPPQDIAAASFTLRACFESFPAGTIFVAVVDPGVGSARRGIVVETPEHCFVGPDNGLFGFALAAPGARVFELAERRYFAARISATFHGRDVFAPAAAHLARGAAAPADFGPPVADAVRPAETAPRRISGNELRGAVLAVDRFGNLVTNLGRADLPPAGFTLTIGGRAIDRHREFFAAGAPGELFTIFGSAGLLEIAAYCDSAARMLDARVGQEIAVTFEA